MAANMQSQLPLDQIGKGGGGAGASLGQQQQPDPLSPSDRTFLGYGGYDPSSGQPQPVDWFSAMGIPGGLNTGAQGQGWAGQSAAPGPSYAPSQQTASTASNPVAPGTPSGISFAPSATQADLQAVQGKGAGTGGGLSASTQPAYAPIGGSGAGAGAGAGTTSTLPGIQSLQGKGGGSATGGLF